MSQAQDAAHSPTSPQSSGGGADSSKNEATPETRLTVFSPDDSQARASKALATLGLDDPSDHPIRFSVKPTDGFSGPDTPAERDPFISSTTSRNPGQKLSPTASAFRPVSTPLVAHGSLNTLQGMNTGVGANRQLFTSPSAPKFSEELGLSRCLVLYSSSQPVMVTDVEAYIAVRSSEITVCRRD
jgi:hypothetical protein